MHDKMISFQVTNAMLLFLLTAAIFELNVITSHPSSALTPKEYQTLKTIGDNSTNHIRAENKNSNLSSTILECRNLFFCSTAQTKNDGNQKKNFCKENQSHQHFYLRI